MYQIEKARLGELFARIAASGELILPVENNGTSQYGTWTPEVEVRLDRLNTVRSAKDCFFPQTENLMGFQMKGKEISIWAQVVSLADGYDALSCKRVYKEALPRGRVLEMIRDGECGVFNPELLRCFFAVEEELAQMYQKEGEKE